MRYRLAVTWVRRHPSGVRWLLVLLTFLALVGFALLHVSGSETTNAPAALDPDGVPLSDPQLLRKIWVLHLPVRGLVLGIWLGLVGLTFWVAARQLAARTYLFASVGLFLSVCGGPVSGLSHCANNLAPWETVVREQAPDGTTYYSMESTFLVGPEVCLTRLESVGVLARTMKVLGCAHGGPQRSVLLVVRSAQQRQPRDGQILRCGRYVVLLQAENQALLLYDTRTRTQITGDGLAAFSPFLCLGPRDEPSVRDLAALKASFLDGAYQGEQSRYPDRVSLAWGLHHPNPAIRAFTRRLLQPPP